MLGHSLPAVHARTCRARRPLSTTCRRQGRHRTTHVAASVVWRQVESTGAWVAHSRAARTRGLVHFLGGAFAGAAPQVLYNLMCNQLADAGYTVIATPYKVTFRHLECAAAVRQQLLDTVADLRSNGRGYLVPDRAPWHGVGHSNGALLHLLGACSPLPPNWVSNTIISYNNKQVADAIPIPGLLESLSGSGGGSSSPSGGLPLPLPSSEQVLAALAASPAAGLLLGGDTQLVAQATPALEQLGSVVQEVQSGLTDFVPNPIECRALIAQNYACPATLLVRFAEDGIDETPALVEALQQPRQQQQTVGPDTSVSGYSSNGGGPSSSSSSSSSRRSLWDSGSFEYVVMPGSHITPCGTDPTWQVGPVYTPADALLQAAKAGSQQDVRELVGRVLSWLKATAA